MRQELDYKKLGLKIKDVRIHQGLTQELLAEIVGCNTSHISNIENAHTRVGLNVLLAIANALHTTIDYLLSDQYSNSDISLNSAILKALEQCDNEKKERILKMIELL